MSDIFDFTAKSALNATQQNENTSNVFNQKPASADKPYLATIRLLPFMKNPKNSIVSSVYHWLVDANGGFKAFSPAIPGARCEVSQKFFQLKEANNSLMSELGIQYDYRVLIQVKQDLQNPDNNGKTFVYRLPVKVFQLIEAALNPSPEQLKLGKKAKDVFNPFDGYDIDLSITKGSKGRNYDSTALADSKTSVLFEGNSVERTPETEKAVIEWLTKLAEENDIEAIYGYKPADDATLIRIKSLLIERYGSSNVLWPHVPYTPSNQQAAPAQPAQPATPAQPAQGTVTQPAAPAAPAQPVQTEAAAPAQPAQPVQTEAAAVQQEANAPADQQPQAENNPGSEVDDIVKAAMGGQ